VNELDQQFTYLPGVGLDIGTAFICRAKQREDGTEDFLSERDAFYSITPATSTNAKLIEKSLNHRKAFMLKKDGKFYVIGQHAVDIANEKQAQVERPLKKGVLSASQIDSFGMLAIVIEALVGKAAFENEQCIFCYPSPPVDAKFDVIYHKQRLAEILRSLGYRPKGILESEALIYSELENEDYTGVSISCGAGMHNISIAYLGDVLLSMSISVGGDWVDERVSSIFNKSESIIQAEKENNLNLDDPADGIQLPTTDPNYEETLRIRKAILDYYDEMIKYVVEHLAKRLNKKKSVLPKFSQPITLVISGGTSMPKGYVERFNQFLSLASLPFTVGEVRRASNPLTAVARGCLIFSQLEG
jgi:actin-like ATPase involved in cell morphogenesis